MLKPAPSPSRRKNTSSIEPLDVRLRQLPGTIRGQSDVVNRVCRTVLRQELQTVPPRGVRGAFIFAGPTGVGKTFLAQSLAGVVFGENRFVRFDCSEFKTLASYESLLGDREGDSGRIAQAHAQASSGVWLFDEIEKAHPDFVHLFLQATDAARITLAEGRTLDLSGIYVILTTNLGSAAIVGREHLPFASLEAHVAREVERWMRPELRGRFGRPYVFRPLNRETQREIAEHQVTKVMEWNRSLGRVIEIGSDVLSFLLCRGFSARLGARPLLQVIEEFTGDAVADDLIQGGSGSGKLVVDDGKLKIVR